MMSVTIILLLCFFTSFAHAQWNYYPPRPIYLRQEKMFSTNPVMRSQMQLRSDITRPKNNHLILQYKIRSLRPDQYKLTGLRPDTRASPAPNLDDLNGYDDDVANVKYVEPHLIQPNEHLGEQTEKFNLHLHPLLLCGDKELSRDHFCFNNQPYNSFLYAVCGTNIYKKPTHFCYDGQTYSRLRKGLCDKKLYDKLSQRCINGNLKSFCGGDPYDPETHFCYQKVYSKQRFSICGKKVYKTKTHFCYKNKLAAKPNMEPEISDLSPSNNQLPVIDDSSHGSRGNPYHNNFDAQEHKYREGLASLEAILKHQTGDNIAWFNKNQVSRSNNPTTKFDHSLRMKAKTGDKKNTLPEKENQGNSRGNLRFCGDTKYSEMTHFCYRNDIIRRCGTVAYNPEPLLCYNNFLYKRDIYETCGHNLYNKFTQTCEGGKVYQRHQYPHELSLANPNKVKSLEHFLLKYRKKIEQNEDQHLLDYSKKLLQERAKISKLFSCNLKRSNEEFCYGNKTFSNKTYGVCNKRVYYRPKYRCLNGSILFPIINRGNM